MAGLQGFVHGWANHLISIAEAMRAEHPGGMQNSSQWPITHASQGLCVEGARDVGLDLPVE